LTFDAFDRVVEENNSGTYKQILYSPIGKLALMAKQVANNVFLPLPGGEQATYTNATIRFRHYDWLGSARFESNMSEQEYGDLAYAPFGESYSIKNTPYLSFTGENQDTISGSYDFLYREYNSAQGRWISSDPAGLGAVDPSNPQSWNRYSYVMNNPLSAIDSMGLSPMAPSRADQYTCDPGGCVTCSMVTQGGDFNLPCGLLGGGDATTGCPFNNCSGYGSAWTVTDSGTVMLQVGSSSQWSVVGTTFVDHKDDEWIELGSVSYNASISLIFLNPGAANRFPTVSAASGSPWYKNSCITGALASGALQAGVDSIGLIPEAGGIARVIGHQAGYVGVVADQLGNKVVKAVGESTGTVSSLAGLGDSSPEGLLSTGLTVAGFIPGAGQVASGFSIALDIIRQQRRSENAINQRYKRRFKRSEKSAPALVGRVVPNYRRTADLLVV
jgi:RHS repeat-associated protein